MTSVLSGPSARLRRLGLPPGLAARRAARRARRRRGRARAADAHAVDDASSLDLRVTEGLGSVTAGSEPRLGIEAGELDRRIEEARGSVSAAC